MMDDLFDPEHLFYGLIGAVLIGLLGYFVGLGFFSLTASSASYNANATTANFFITRFSSLPLAGTIAGVIIGFAGGIARSYERKKSLHGQLPVIALPQASGSQTPIILVPQQPQQPQVPQIVVVPQAGGQQPVVVVPQQPQQK